MHNFDSAQLTSEVYLSVPDHPGQHAPLIDFIDACSALRRTLQHVERCISGGALSLEYEVTELSVSSAKIGTAPLPRNGQQEILAAETRRVHSETMSKLQRGVKALDPRLDPTAIRSFGDFGKPMKRGKVQVQVDGVTLSLALLDNIEEILRPINPAFGSVSGIVEQLNIHSRNTFVLFPPGTNEAVHCNFPPEIFESKVRPGLKRNVTVYGLLHYGLGRSFPVTADVDDIEVHPSDDELPSLLDLEGMLQGLDRTTSHFLTGSETDEWK